MSTVLFVGGTTDSPTAGLDAFEQNLIVGDKLVSVDVKGKATLGRGPLTETFISFYDTVFLSPWDILFSIILGVATKGVEKMLKAKPKNKKEAFRNGFVIGGGIGGLSELLTPIVEIAEGTETGWCGTRPMTTIAIHEFFQGVIFNGAVAGLVNAALTYAKV